MPKLIEIDPEIRTASEEYVKQQLGIMEQFGSMPVVTPDRFNQLAYSCAVYPRRLRNWQKRKEAQLGPKS